MIVVFQGLLCSVGRVHVMRFDGMEREFENLVDLTVNWCLDDAEIK